MNALNEHYSVAVIGGGFYGCAIAHHLRRYVPRVIVLEKNADIMQRASLNNQARVHNGYHYPRSLLTAMRSRLHFPRFVREYGFCIDDRFEKYYAVASQYSKVTAAQFYAFCQRIGSPIEPASEAICKLFDPRRVEAVFRVVEYAFDAAKLKDRLREMLEDDHVVLRLGARVTRLARASAGQVLVSFEDQNGPAELHADSVINCTYSQINQVLSDSGLPVVPLKHELTELALVEMPEPLRRIGVTVMCGPFFSFMPFPSKGLHTLSHVRYTPHQAWEDRSALPLDAHGYLDGARKTSQFAHMRNDAARYMPSLRECRYTGSLWEVKTVLPANEHDDGRPILFKRQPGLPSLLSVLGSKIDNIYDALEELDALYQKREAA